MDLAKVDKTPKESVGSMIGRVPRSQREAVSRRVAECPERMRRGYMRSVLGEAGPRMAIRAFCLECCGWSRDEVRACSGLACPLWHYRPGV